MVTSMTPPAHRNFSSEIGSPLDAASGRRPLYLRGAHWFARAGYGLMLLMYLAGVVSLVATFTPHPLDWRDAVGALMIIIFPLIVGTSLRTYAIYGSWQGLETVRWGRRRTVPWSKVGSPEYAWWSLNYAARVARLDVHEEKQRTILFFANDRILKELEAMRGLYAHR
jgi:hypothetical protein